MAQAARKLEDADLRQEDEGARLHHELEQHAAEELSHAIAHDWLELQDFVPYADPLPPSLSCPYEVVRSYRWAGHEGGDMICEVTVYELPNRGGHLVRRSCVISR